MIQRTEVAKALSAAQNKIQYDEHVKRILESRQVLSRILKGAVQEYGPYSVEEIQGCIESDHVSGRGFVDSEQVISVIGDRITGDRNESKISGEGTITYDVRFHAYVPEDGKNYPIKLTAFLSEISDRDQGDFLRGENAV